MWADWESPSLQRGEDVNEDPDRLPSILIGDRYRNKKNRTVYQVISLGRHSEDETPLVTYIKVGGTLRQRFGLWLMAIASRLLRDRPTWSRPTDLFMEKFEEL